MRQLTTEEIAQLEKQGCNADNWKQIQVVDDFVADYIHRVKFTGNNQIGKFETEIELQGGVKVHTGISDAWIHNCTIGNNVFIKTIRDYIGNYNIEDNVIIFDVKLLVVDKETTFGNGIKVEVISEAGTRSVMMYNYLSAHLAYIMASYRHRPRLIERIEKMIGEYGQAQKSTTGRIAVGARIVRCDTIINVNVGEYAFLEAARELKNGTINSDMEDPVYIGDCCQMENFIICSGSSVKSATLVSNCFIGQGCMLDKQYSAVQSLFFANCQGFHGEATSIFAGPYTVTHHKSTLLIAGMYSFMNAGSGSNQSNHLYKLGPIHHGFLERGTKTTSDSYILWPSRVGAFTLVMGRHYNHADTSNFPFSYLIEYNDQSYLAPAVNLRSIGTVRDSQKWPTRDMRKSKMQLDYINYNLLSPYTMWKIIKGRDILVQMRDENEVVPLYDYQGVKIESRILNRGIRFYECALTKFLGNSMVSRLEKTTGPLTEEKMRELFKKDTETGGGKWLDVAGLICPACALDRILDGIESGKEKDLCKLQDAFKELHEQYYSYEWTWACEVLENISEKRLDEFTAQDVLAVVKKWITSVLDIDKMLYEDAKKEFALSKMSGFGADGDGDVKEKDFENVRGTFDTNTTVLAILEHMKVKEALANKIIQRIEDGRKN